MSVSTRQTDTDPGLGRVGGIIGTALRHDSDDDVQNFRWIVGIFFLPPSLKGGKKRAKTNKNGQNQTKTDKNKQKQAKTDKKQTKRNGNYVSPRTQKDQMGVL